LKTPRDKVVCDISKKVKVKAAESKLIEEKLDGLFAETDGSAAYKIFAYVRDSMSGFDAERFRFAIEAIKSYSLKNDAFKQTAITALTLLNDLRYNTGKIKRSSVLQVLKINIDEILATTPLITEKNNFTVCSN